MIGRVGTHFGEHGLNIVSAAVGRHPDTVHVGEGLEAVMVITTDAAVPQAVINEIVGLDGFEAGRTVTL
jgi:D-3-phosphoglycerate dehydrogenase